MNNLFNIPNFITFLNLLCGILAIKQAFLGNIATSGFLIIIGMFLDFFDGFAARLLKRNSIFGKQLDSLSDLVTFGIAPAALLTAALPRATVITHAAAVVFAASIALRLVRFTMRKASVTFKGVPSTISGGFIAFMFLFFPEIMDEKTALTIVLILSMMSVSGIRYPKLRLQTRKKNIIIYIFVAGFYLLSPKYCMLSVFIAYFTVSPLFVALIDKKRAASAEEKAADYGL